MRHAEHGAFQNSLDCIQLDFDFFGIDVAAAADHQVFGAADDMHVAVAIDSPHISRLEPAIGAELTARFLLVAPVSCEHIRTFDLEGADDIRLGFDPAALSLPHAHRNSFQRRTDRSGQSHAIIGIGCVHHGFRHAVALQNHMTRALLKFSVSLRQQGRRTRNEQAHRRRRISIQTSLLQQARVVRRHAHVNRGLRKLLERLSRIEFRSQKQTGI